MRKAICMIRYAAANIDVNKLDYHFVFNVIISILTEKRSCDPTGVTLLTISQQQMRIVLHESIFRLFL